MVLKSIAFIPDGNRRFAKKQGIRLESAYEMGTQKSWKVLEWLAKYPTVKFGTFYTLSLENMRRQKNELGLLFAIFERALDRARNEPFLDTNGIRVLFSGRRELFPQSLQKKMRELEAHTESNSEKTVNLALGYSGQHEIVDAAKRVAADVQAGKLNAHDFDEAAFRAYLYQDLPDPDLIIRTSGTQRLSGFLTYQSAYSELYFSPKFWPEFNEADLDAAIESYSLQQRNFGK